MFLKTQRRDVKLKRNEAYGLYDEFLFSADNKAYEFL